MLAYKETVSDYSNEEIFSSEYSRHTLADHGDGYPIDLTPRVKNKTDIDCNFDSVNFKLITASGVKKNAAPINDIQHLEDKINGSIIQVQETSVKCDIYTKNHEQIIFLPKSLFQIDVKIGTPFTLSIDDSSGIRMPIIKTRQLAEDLANKGKDEVAALIDDL